MVLASNEWLNFCDDDQKPANNTATTAAAAATTTTTTANTNTPADAANTQEIATTSTANADNLTVSGDIDCSSISTTATDETTTIIANAKRVTSTTTITPGTATTTTTPNAAVVAIGGGGKGIEGIVVTDNANNEAFLEYHQQHNKPPPPTYEEVLLLNTANLKIMAENTNAMIKSELKQFDLNATASTATVIAAASDANTAPNATAAVAAAMPMAMATATAAIDNESANNNSQLKLDQEETLSHSTSFVNDTLSETIISNSANANNVANSNSNSNSNTLQPNAMQRQHNKANTQQQQQRHPITSQALNSALQSVMNASATATNAMNGGGGASAPLLPDNFLSALGIGGSASMSAMQQTAKQLTASFCLSNSISDTNLTAPTTSAAAAAAASAIGTTTAGSGMGNVHVIMASGTSGTALAAASAAYNESQLELSCGSGQAKIVLLCDTNSHPFQTRTILMTPNIECKVGRLIAKSKAAESNAIFDCKVLSRNHAVLWYTEDGKFWVKDTKSSNGTFINENKLGTEAAELHFGDIVKFGVDVLENSRKEVHGCIIACVKLYLPDGREAISIDAHGQRTQFSGEGRLTSEELHRLNLYMQEASQREKTLKAKLYNIQNVLDATRKNSAMCWQSMIAEDQLLHRISTLEKKLQVMEKNAPESALRNEVLKLLEEKSTYQQTAKEALRKVYQERCDALQMFTKIESAYSTADSECKILRDQIMCTKQALQDVNTRLLRLETEYNDYKDDCERHKQEAKEQEEKHTIALTDKLNQYEVECEQLRRKIAELLLKRAEQLDAELEGKHAATNADSEAAEQAKLERQAIEKLDAAIADMDMDDDDDDDDEDEEDEIENGAGNGDNDDVVDINESSRRKSSSVVDTGKVNGHHTKGSKQYNWNDEQKDAASMFVNFSTQNLPPKEDVKNKVVKESTIMKWLQNSDMNKDACSLDIFKAICNDQDDELETSSLESDGIKTSKSLPLPITNNKSAEEFQNKCSKFTRKLYNVQMNLKELEADLEKETSKAEDAIASLDDGSQLPGDDSEDELSADIDEASNEFIVKGSEAKPDYIKNFKIRSNKSYILLKHSVCMLREAYNEICNNVQYQQQLVQYAQIQDKNKESTPPPAISVQTQFQAAYAPQSSGSSAVKKFETQETLKPLAEVNSDEEVDVHDAAKPAAASAPNDSGNAGEVDDDEDDISETTSSTQLSTASQLTICQMNAESTHNLAERQRWLEQQLMTYEQQVHEMQEKLDSNDNDAQNTLEIMQIECDTFKDKVYELTKLVDTLRDEKQTLQIKLTEQQQLNNTNNCETTASSIASYANESSASDAIAFEQQTTEELAIINSKAVECEEELIMYKERLEHTQNENINLRYEIAELQRKSNDYAQSILKRMLPYGVAVIAILVYILSLYF